MIVLDASAVLELLLNTVVGRRVAERIAPPGITLHAPHLIDLEVAQILRRYVLRGTIEAQRGALALEHLTLLDLERYAHDLLLPRIWALRENVTAHDAAYVALAETLGASLMTTDRRLAGAAGIRARIELV